MKEATTINIQSKPLRRTDFTGSHHRITGQVDLLKRELAREVIHLTQPMEGWNHERQAAQQVSGRQAQFSKDGTAHSVRYFLGPNYTL
jgi:hypothetical protein